MWLPVPDRLLEQRPIEIYRGDLVKVGDKVGIFVKYNIANGSWVFVDSLTRERIDMPSLASLTGETVLKVLRNGLIPS